MRGSCGCRGMNPLQMLMSNQRVRRLHQTCTPNNHPDNLSRQRIVKHHQVSFKVIPIHPHEFFLLILTQKDLLISLQSDELKRLEFWSEAREIRVDPQKTERFLANTRYIIQQLPGLLGYKKPGSAPIRSPMLKNIALCIKRCKDGM